MQRVEQLRGPREIVEGLTDLDRLGTLDRFAAALRGATSSLLGDGADPLEVTAGIASVNDALTTRLLHLAEARLGRPPYAYAWLALGSHGRGEQVLSSDQDSALAYGGPRLGDAEPEPYFAALATHVVDGLARAGIPRCTGGFMATTWNLPLQELADSFTAWVDNPVPEELVRAEVFLDVRPVHGALDVSLLHGILEAGGRRRGFMVQMARAAVTFRPPPVVWRRVRTEHGALDVKRRGTAAIVLLARLYALAAGSAARTTRLRLEAARDAGTLSASGVEGLLEAYRLLTGLRLRHQVEQAATGTPPDSLVPLAGLTTAERRRLLEALQAVRVMQEITERRYQTHTVT
ncbi:MAG TPA: putative nucleotidyltransferase substrate binding domain-containing protein [Nocardioides sp.]|nr:putative nucleotidyltransferase substrate binding domain-containing protein [Nocardioides sp.]